MSGIVTVNADTSQGAFVRIVKETGMVSGRVFGADRTPLDITMPYVTVQELAADVAHQGDAGLFAEWRKTFQIDIVQEYRKDTYSTELKRNLIAALKLAVVTVAGHRVRVRVVSSQRIPVEPGETAVREALTVSMFQPESSI